MKLGLMFETANSGVTLQSTQQGKRKEVGPNWARWEISLKASTHAVPLTSTDVSKG